MRALDDDGDLSLTFLLWHKAIHQSTTFFACFCDGLDMSLDDQECLVQGIVVVSSSPAAERRRKQCCSGTVCLLAVCPQEGDAELAICQKTRPHRRAAPRANFDVEACAIRRSAGLTEL